jgi:hypothetical protein
MLVQDTKPTMEANLPLVRRGKTTDEQQAKILHGKML